MSKENEGKIKKAIADVKRKINKAIVAGAVGVVVGSGAGYVAGNSGQDKQEDKKELKDQLKSDIMELIERDFDEDPALRDIIRKYYTDKTRNINFIVGKKLVDRKTTENEAKMDKNQKEETNKGGKNESVKNSTMDFGGETLRKGKKEKAKEILKYINMEYEGKTLRGFHGSRDD